MIIDFFFHFETVPGGLTVREGVTIVETLYDLGRLEAIDLTEVNPGIGSLTDVKRTLDSAFAVLKAACGNQRSGNLPTNIIDIPRP